jgi:hypothetical protein
MSHLGHDNDQAQTLIQGLVQRITALERRLTALELAARPELRRAFVRDQTSGDNVPGPEPEDNEGPGIPLPPPFPEIGFQMSACLDQPLLGLTRAALQNQLLRGVQSMEQNLNTLGVSLFPNPQVYTNCLDDNERGGIWGRQTFAADADLDEIARRMRFLGALNRPGVSLFGGLLTGQFLQRFGRALEDVAFRRFGFLIQRIDFEAAQSNVLRVLVRIHVGPDLFPQRVTLPVVVAFSVDADRGELRVRLDIGEPDIDLDLALRVFGDLSTGFFVEYPQLVPGQRPALERRGRGLQCQGQTHYQKGLRFSDLSWAGSCVVPYTWRPTRAEVHPQIFLRRQKNFRHVRQLS